MYKAIAITNLYFKGKRYGKGEEIVLTPEQVSLLDLYIKDVQPIEEDKKDSDKPKRASSRGKKAKS